MAVSYLKLLFELSNSGKQAFFFFHESLRLFCPEFGCLYIISLVLGDLYVVLNFVVFVVELKYEVVNLFILRVGILLEH